MADERRIDFFFLTGYLITIASLGAAGGERAGRAKGGNGYASFHRSMGSSIPQSSWESRRLSLKMPPSEGQESDQG